MKCQFRQAKTAAGEKRRSDQLPRPGGLLGRPGFFVRDRLQAGWSEGMAATATEPRQGDLIWLDQAAAAIARVATIGESKAIADKAAAIKVFARKQDWSVEQRAKISEIEIRAVARLGELLKNIVVPRGNHDSGRHGSAPSLPPEVTKKQSHRAQQIASIPAKEREKYIAENRDQDRLSVTGLAKLAKTAARVKKKKSQLHEAAKSAPKSPDWEIVEGDCGNVLKTLDERSVRLIFADPPYNIGIDYGNGVKADKLPGADYMQWAAEWIQDCRNVLTDDGSLWVMIGDEYAAEYCVALKAVGFTIRSWIKWYETFGVNCTNNFNRTSRHIFYAVVNPKKFIFNAEAVSRQSDRQAKYGDKRANPDGKIWDDVWQISRVTGTSDERIPDFPTQLPLAITRAIVGCASDAGDLVIDPFNGSGSTGVAAIELRRKYLGIEKSAEFCRLARMRLQGTQPMEDAT